MKENFLVSVIVPVYNVEKYLDECIKSIMEQSYTNLEILLIDDGSSDNSINICNRYSLIDNRIRVISQKNGGASKARNRGIRESCGEYIIFIDSDDYWDDLDALKVMIGNMSESGADILQFGYKKYYEDINHIENYRYNFKRIDINLKSKRYTLNYFAKYNLMYSSPCNKLIKRSLLIEGEIVFIEGITSEDIDWNARLFILAKKFDVIDKSIYVYRQRYNSVSNSINKDKLIQLKRNINKCIEYVDTYSLKDEEFFYEYMSYVAYQYMTLLVSSNMYNGKLDKEFKSSIKENKYLLKYDLNYRVHIFNLINRYLGYGGLNLFINIFLKIKKGL